MGQRVVIEQVLIPWLGHSWTCWSDHACGEWGHLLQTAVSLGEYILDMSHTEVRSCNSLAGQTLTLEALESLTRETNHTTHQHISHSATTPTMKTQLFSLGFATGGVTGAERGPHRAASLQRSIVEPQFQVEQLAAFRAVMFVGGAAWAWNGIAKQLHMHRLQHSTCAMMGTKAGADQRGDPLKMVAVSKCLSV